MAGKWFSPQGFIRFYGMGHHGIGRQRRYHPCFRAGKDVPTRQTDGVTSLEWGLTFRAKEVKLGSTGGTRGRVCV